MKERPYLCMAPSGTPDSEPSPHLISMEGGGVVLLLDSFGAPSQNSIDAVLILAIERSKTMMNVGLMVQLPWPHKISVLMSEVES